MDFGFIGDVKMANYNLLFTIFDRLGYKESKTDLHKYYKMVNKCIVEFRFKKTGLTYGIKLIPMQYLETKQHVQELIDVYKIMKADYKLLNQAYEKANKYVFD